MTPAFTRLRGVTFRVEQAVETVFGPDPGVLRLWMGGRSLSRQPSP